MKIAIVYPALRAVGGAENVVIWLAESLTKKGHTVVLFTREFSEAVWGPIREQPYGVHLLDFKKYRSTLKTNREAGTALGEALSSHDLDVINPHNYPASLWVYYAKGRKRDFPKVVLFLHNLTRNFYEKIIDVHYGKLPGFRNIWERYRPKKLLRSFRQTIFNYQRLDQEAVRACDAVLANSSYTAELAGKIYHREVRTCTLGVSLERLYPQHEQGTAYKKTDDHSTTIVTVARIEPQKNLDTILKALKILSVSRGLPIGFKYKIAGSGPLLNYYKKKSRHMGLEGIVRFLGSIPHREIWKLYAEADFLVHVPLDEPFGLVPLEAALFGKPSIVSNHGGPAETVINGVTGLHVNALDPEDVAAKIEYLLSNPKQAALLGNAANDWVRKNLTWEVFLDKFESHLVQAFGRKFQ